MLAATGATDFVHHGLSLSSSNDLSTTTLGLGLMEFEQLGCSSERICKAKLGRPDYLMLGWRELATAL